MNYLAVLQHYTIQGYRVLALAFKTFSPHLTRIHQMSREEIEVDAQLIGLLVMRNRLKKETLPSIRILREANIRTMMVTGDNLQTAVKVAKDCEMIGRAQRVIQVEATNIPASDQGAQHLQVIYYDPLATSEFIAGTVCCCPVNIVLFTIGEIIVTLLFLCILLLRIKSVGTCITVTIVSPWTGTQMPWTKTKLAKSFATNFFLQNSTLTENCNSFLLFQFRISV